MFSNIDGLRAFFDVPVMALSASAPSAIQATITESLKLVDPVIVYGSLNRPNIIFLAGKITGLAVSLRFPDHFHCALVFIT